MKQGQILETYFTICIIMCFLTLLIRGKILLLQYSVMVV
jgi:hypothetical protein